jgi:hypothetical protein
MEPFVKEIFSYDFYDTPNYSKLKHLLTSLLLEHDVSPDQVFDWSLQKKRALPPTPASNEFDDLEIGEEIFLNN